LADAFTPFEVSFGRAALSGKSRPLFFCVPAAIDKDSKDNYLSAMDDFHLRKLAHSERRFGDGHAQTDLDRRRRALASNRGTARGEIGDWLVVQGPGAYSVETIRRGVADKLLLSTPDVIKALKFLEKKINFRELVGLCMEFDVALETVIITMRNG
jgi:hypothetical protein